MQTYDQDRCCPKCGSPALSTHYMPLGNRIERVCQRCEHWWYEKALDVPNEGKAQ